MRPDLARARRRGAVAIAIDGPGGAGKSTLAKMVAEALGFVYVDTGAMYRAAALYCMRKGIDLSDGSLLARRLQSVEAVLDSMDLEIKFVDGAQKIFLCGGDVTEAIRDSAVGTGASQVSVIPAVREKLVALQRKLAQDCDVVMDGRDIGTHVLPNARLKIYLDADLKTRVTRRLKDLREKGREAESVEVERELRERDHRDMTRDASPLCKADDAVVLDTSNLTREEAREKIIELFRRGSEFSLRENGLTAGSLEVTRNVL
ncbi:MAG: (d)CMP kinase [Clostridiales bacterium]|nr:(d)CMP kinase [Clostridiales bacterium]